MDANLLIRALPGAGLAFVMLALVSPSPGAEDPLPSWREGDAKRSIVAFVRRVTESGGEGFVPVADRVAVFDNDGTLWPENPLPFQLAFALDELRRLAPDHPEWLDDPVLRAAVDGDTAVLKADLKPALLKVLAATHGGGTTDEFAARVRAWVETARHPRFDRPYVELGYRPMVEVLAYLRSHGFKTYIVSGGGVDFMRVWAEAAYGVPPEQVIGSEIALAYELGADGPVLRREASLAFIDDKAGKPVAIHRRIGRRPIACFGNSDGDLQMLQWTTIGRPASFGLIVHHTDAEREYAYDARPQSSGKLVQALGEADSRGWTVVDMRRDWRVVFAAP